MSNNYGKQAIVKHEGAREQTASMEDYLEAIATLSEGRKVVRVKQISQMLGVKMPSVTSALKKLSERGLVEHAKYGHIKLTLEGDKVARDVIDKHQALTSFFAQALGIDRETAEEDACKIEHVISSLSMERLARFVDFMGACPLGSANCSSRYEYYLEHGKLPRDCSTRSTRKEE